MIVSYLFAIQKPILHKYEFIMKYVHSDRFYLATALSISDISADLCHTCIVDH